MLRVAASNESPKINSLRIRRHATSSDEANEIFAQNEDRHIIPVGINSMPYIELQSDIPKEDRPRLKKFRAGETFRLAVYNFSANPEVPFVGFSIERVNDNESIYLEGSHRIIDPSKSNLTQCAIAVIPLLHVFNAQIQTEAKRASDLIAKASSKKGIISISEERDKRMMDDALTATYNVMQALYGDEERETIEQPKTGTDCLAEKLQPALDASGAFYDALINKARVLFEPSIRTLAENVALGRVSANSTSPIRVI